MNNTITKTHSAVTKKTCNESGVQERMNYIDYAKAIGIILVIAGHTNSYNSFCKVWIYSFHMPLFFLLNGLILRPKSDNFITTVIKKAKRLLVPYFLWGLIYSSLSARNIAYICYGSYESLSKAKSLTSLWFFPVLFLADILSERVILLLKRVGIRRQTTLLLLISGGMFLIGFVFPSTDYGYPFGLNVVFVAVGFIFIAYSAVSFFTKIKWGGSTLILFLVACASAFISLGAYLNIPDCGYILVGNGEYGNPIIFILVAIAGSSLILCISILIERISPNYIKKILSFIGENSLTFILLQKPIISIFENIFGTVTMPSALSLFIVVIVTLAICCVVTMFINYFAPQIVGR